MASNLTSTGSLLAKLRQVELGRGSFSKSVKVVPSIARRIDQQQSGVVDMTEKLRTAMRDASWRQIEDALSEVLTALSDVSSDTYDPFQVKGKKRQQREYFVLYGGLQAVLQFFTLRGVPKNGRTMSPEQMTRRVEVFCIVLVLLRELIVSNASIAEQFFDDSLIATLMTYLSHKQIFDHTMNLLEEILAIRHETFPLSSVPDFSALVEGFSSPQLSHFCRILSLVVFEPEDRQLLDNATQGQQAPKSFEVLILRQKRMSKNASLVLEQNQCLVIELPCLLRRLVTILNIICLGPNLQEQLTSSLLNHLPLGSEIMELKLNQGTAGTRGEWRELDEMLERIRSYHDSHPEEREQFEEERGAMNADLLRAFSLSPRADPASSGSNASSAPPPPPPPPSPPSRQAELVSMMNVLTLAENMGVGRVTPLGEALLSAQIFMLNEGGGAGGRNPNIPRRRSGGPNNSSLTSPHLRSDSTPRGSARAARNHLQFQSMLLIPHQVELLFVLCTLLSGRRKYKVQKALRQLHLTRVLVQLFDQVWGMSPGEGEEGEGGIAGLSLGMSTNHPHGPHCECTPESAVRIQYLRLLHNYYDLDFLGSRNKGEVLGKGERKWLARGGYFDVDGFAGDKCDDDDDDEDALIIPHTHAPQAGRNPYPLPLSSFLLSECEGIVMKLLKVLTVDHDAIKKLRKLKDAEANTTATSSSNNYMPKAINKEEERDDDRDEGNTATPATTATPTSAPTLRLAPNYRFWISACLENFLRGAGWGVQCMVMRGGGVGYAVDYILYWGEHGGKASGGAGSGGSCPTTGDGVAGEETAEGSDPSTPLPVSSPLSDHTLQTTFDLLGEMLKGNPLGPALLTQALTASDLPLFLSLLSDNLIDSNVCLRSLVLTIEMMRSSDMLDGSMASRSSSPSLHLTSAITAPQPSPEAPSSSWLEAGQRTLSLFHYLPCTILTPKGVGEGEDDTLPITLPPHPAPSPRFVHDSWIHFHPAVSSPLASQLLSHPRDTFQTYKKMRGRGAGAAAGSNTGSIGESSPPRKSIWGEAWRRATSQFLRFGNQSSLSPPRNPSAPPSPSPSPPPLPLTSTPHGADAYHTPPEGPHFSRSPHPFPIAAATSPAPAPSLVLTEDLGNAFEPLLPLTRAPRAIAEDSPFSLLALRTPSPTSLLTYLDSSRAELVVKLMASVSLATVSHETICCINTALLIMLFEHNKGRLPNLIAEVKRVASEQYAIPTIPTPSTLPLPRIRPTPRKRKCGVGMSEGLCTDPSCDGRISVSEGYGLYCGVCLSPETGEKLGGSEILCRNFRMLLWYWGEYYLRRGRDRLSIEFSTHLPFQYWKDAVDLLCADDGSPMSLLSSPIPLPLSPYCRVGRDVRREIIRQL